MRRLDTKLNLIIQAVRMPFFRLPTLLTLISIQVLFDIAYHHIHTFQVPQYENNEEWTVGKTEEVAAKIDVIVVVSGLQVHTRDGRHPGARVSTGRD